MKKITFKEKRLIFQRPEAEETFPFENISREKQVSRMPETSPEEIPEKTPEEIKSLLQSQIEELKQALGEVVDNPEKYTEGLSSLAKKESDELAEIETGLQGMDITPTEETMTTFLKEFGQKIEERETAISGRFSKEILDYHTNAKNKIESKFNEIKEANKILAEQAEEKVEKALIEKGILDKDLQKQIIQEKLPLFLAKLQDKTDKATDILTELDKIEDDTPEKSKIINGLAKMSEKLFGGQEIDMYTALEIQRFADLAIEKDILIPRLQEILKNKGIEVTIEKLKNIVYTYELGEYKNPKKTREARKILQAIMKIKEELATAGIRIDFMGGTDATNHMMKKRGGKWHREKVDAFEKLIKFEDRSNIELPPEKGKLVNDYIMAVKKDPKKGGDEFLQNLPPDVKTQFLNGGGLMDIALAIQRVENGKKMLTGKGFDMTQDHFYLELDTENVKSETSRKSGIKLTAIKVEPKPEPEDMNLETIEMAEPEYESKSEPEPATPPAPTPTPKPEPEDMNLETIEMAEPEYESKSEPEPEPAPPPKTFFEGVKKLGKKVTEAFKRGVKKAAEETPSPEAPAPEAEPPAPALTPEGIEKSVKKWFPEEVGDKEFQFSFDREEKKEGDFAKIKGEEAGITTYHIFKDNEWEKVGEIEEKAVPAAPAKAGAPSVEKTTELAASTGGETPTAPLEKTPPATEKPPGFEDENFAREISVEDDKYILQKVDSAEDEELKRMKETLYKSEIEEGTEKPFNTKEIKFAKYTYENAIFYVDNHGEVRAYSENGGETISNISNGNMEITGIKNQIEDVTLPELEL